MAEKKAKEIWLVVWGDGSSYPVCECDSFTAAQKRVFELVCDGIEVAGILVYKALEAYKISLELVKV